MALGRPILSKAKLLIGFISKGDLEATI